MHQSTWKELWFTFFKKFLDFNPFEINKFSYLAKYFFFFFWKFTILFRGHLMLRVVLTSASWPCTIWFVPRVDIAKVFVETPRTLLPQYLSKHQDSWKGRHYIMEKRDKVWQSNLNILLFEDVSKECVWFEYVCKAFVVCRHWFLCLKWPVLRDSYFWRLSMPPSSDAFFCVSVDVRVYICVCVFFCVCVCV